MSEFKVGDRVRVVDFPTQDSEWIGALGTVTNVDDHCFPIAVRPDDMSLLGGSNFGLTEGQFNPEELEAVTHE